MSKKIIGNIIITIIVLVMLLALAFNVYKVETYKLEQKKLQEEQARIEKLEEEIKKQQELREKRLEELKREKEKEVVEIIDFHKDYVSLRQTFLTRISALESSANHKVGNIEAIKELTGARIEASKEFKNNFENMEYIPEPLQLFYEYNIDFLTMDLKYWLLVEAYYDRGKYSTNNSQDIEEFKEKVISLFNKAGKELKRVYENYDLEYLIENII